MSLGAWLMTIGYVASLGLAGIFVARRPELTRVPDPETPEFKRFTEYYRLNHYFYDFFIGLGAIFLLPFFGGPVGLLISPYSVILGRIVFFSSFLFAIALLLMMLTAWTKFTRILEALSAKPLPLPIDKIYPASSFLFTAALWHVSILVLLMLFGPYAPADVVLLLIPVALLYYLTHSNIYHSTHGFFRFMGRLAILVLIWGFAALIPPHLWLAIVGENLQPAIRFQGVDSVAIQRVEDAEAAARQKICDKEFERIAKQLEQGVSIDEMDRLTRDKKAWEDYCSRSTRWRLW